MKCKKTPHKQKYSQNLHVFIKMYFIYEHNLIHDNEKNYWDESVTPKVLKI
jgi:hypothetical protein